MNPRAWLGDGRIARLIAAHDWSSTPPGSTPLGTLEHWPASLRFAVALLLRSPLPMVLIWGRHGIFFHNDAYASSIGDPHAHALHTKVPDGALSAFHVRALQTCLAGETLSCHGQEVVLEHRGRMFLDLDYWPVVDDSGRPVGAFGNVRNTTARMLAASELRKNAERFRAFMVASTTSMYRMSPDWKEMRQLDGQSFLCDTAEPSADWLQTYVPAVEHQRVLERIEHAIRAKEPFDLEHRVQLADGSFGWVHSRAVPLLDEHGEIEEWFGAASDVTERKRMEDALRAGEERFRLLYEAQHTAHLVLAPDLTIEAASEQYLQASLLREEELVGKHLFEAFSHPPGDPQHDAVQNLFSSLNWVREHRRPHRMAVQKYDIRLPSGELEVRWWSPVNIPVLAADGTVRHLIHQVEDVTAVMQERQKTAEAKAGEARYRAMADALPQLAWIADEKGWIYWYNRRWYEYTGSTLEEMEGWGWRKVHHPDHVDRVVKSIQHSWDTGEPWEDTFPLRGKHGQYRWFLSRAVPLKDAEGHVIRWFGTNTDITEQQQREHFQQLLLREVSHRVKNSLAMVSGLLDLQARSLSDSMRHAIEDASVRVRTVATVHDQLCRQADARDIELAPFLSSLAAAIATAAPQHATVVDVEPAIVSADAAVPIGLLVNELVTNAYKHAYDPDTIGEVRITGHRTSGSCYEIEVADSGRGLPKDFELYKSSRASLGMRVITSLTAQLGGSLQVSSARAGTRFRVVFPIKVVTS